LINQQEESPPSSERRQKQLLISLLIWARGLFKDVSPEVFIARRADCGYSWHPLGIQLGAPPSPGRPAASYQAGYCRPLIYWFGVESRWRFGVTVAQVAEPLAVKVVWI
jgi:hypothetical protein